MNFDWKSRFRNKYFIMSIISSLLLLAKQLGFEAIIPENFEAIVDTVLSLLVTVGVLINPTTDGFLDGGLSETNE